MGMNPSSEPEAVAYPGDKLCCTAMKPRERCGATRHIAEFCMGMAYLFW